MKSLEKFVSEHNQTQINEHSSNRLIMKDIIDDIKPEVDAWIEENKLPLYTKIYDGPKVYGLEIRFASDNRSEDFAYKTHYWLLLKFYNETYLECNGYVHGRLLKIDNIKDELDKQLKAYRNRTNYM